MFWFTFNLAVDFRAKMALTLKFYQTKCTLYLGIALSTQFSSSSLVLEGRNLHSAICFANQCVRSELPNKLGNDVTSVDEYECDIFWQKMSQRSS